MNYMKNPRKVLVAYLAAHDIPHDWSWGQVSIGLELVQLIKNLEEFPFTSVGEAQGTISCVHTLLVEQGLEQCYEVYDTLAQWRLTVVEREPSLQDTEHASEPQHARPSSSPSELAAHRSMPAQRPMPGK